MIAALNAGAEGYLVKLIDFEVLDARRSSMQRIAHVQNSMIGILNNVYKAILTIDEAGIVQSFNKGAKPIIAHSAAKFIGTNVRMLMPLSIGEANDGYFACCLHGRKRLES